MIRFFEAKDGRPRAFINTDIDIHRYNHKPYHSSNNL